MRARILSIAAVLCALQVPARANEANAALALRLVSVMGIDLQMAIGVRSIGEQMYRTGQLDEIQRDCLRGVDRAAFTALLQESATRELSASELRAAELGLRMPDFTPAEYDAMRAFGASPAGVKLLARSVLTQSDSATDGIVRKTRQLIGECTSPR